MGLFLCYMYPILSHLLYLLLCIIMRNFPIYKHISYLKYHVINLLLDVSENTRGSLGRHIKSRKTAGILRGVPGFTRGVSFLYP